MTVTELATLATVGGVGLAIFLATVGAALAFGRMSQRVTQVEAGLGEVKAEIAGLRSEMQQGFAEMRAEHRAEMAELRAQMTAMQAQMERMNGLLIGVANHRHDTDGNTVFNVPGG